MANEPDDDIDEESELLLELLRDRQRSDDPIPATATELAKAIPGLQALDRQLAALVESTVATRNEDEPLVYRTDEVTIILEIGQNTLELDALDLEIERVDLQWADQTTDQFVADSGVWKIEPARSGPARAVLATTGAIITTEWFTVPSN